MSCPGNQQHSLATLWKESFGCGIVSLLPHLDSAVQHGPQQQDMPPIIGQGMNGLTEEQVLLARQRFGKNEITSRTHSFLDIALDIVKEPMVILLLTAALLYFFSGEMGDGIFMTCAIFLVVSISLYQESRSHRALEALKNLTQRTCKVIRDSQIREVNREDIVIGDLAVIEEGTIVPADGVIVQSNDFSVNESILTGESLPVSKNKTSDSNNTNEVFQGTTVVAGLAIFEVTAVGDKTALGTIGKSLESIQKEKTPLQAQINSFVKKMAFAGIIVFVIVWGINYFQSHLVFDSLLKALTLAMSILPEEIPVAFTTFMALGAWRLMKLGIIVKQIRTVETLGSATVICTDKTGTITENRMSLANVFVLSTGKISSPDAGPDEIALVRYAMWASEPIPFDPMEKALHDAYEHSTSYDERRNFRMVHEYPLDGRPPMMTHIFENTEGERIVSAKGAPEALIAVSRLTDQQVATVNNALKTFTKDGYRVLGVGVSEFDGNDFPARQQQLKFTFLGLVAFFDPPKRNIESVFEAFYRAGIAVKIITGDNAATTSTIARQVNFRGADETMNGEELMKMDEKQLIEKVSRVNIFTRMFPDAKLRILNALKANNHIVAMTGDGVNDGPALKGAHIGVAMGKRGSELAKDVSSLILTDDDLARMVDAIAMGRKIYSNLKKAIQYIISIHIPIILTVFVPLVLGWIYPNILSPVHVIFLELIMGPTCSIIYENEPMEKNAMARQPRAFTKTFFSTRELGTSIVQGLVISIGTLAVYQFSVNQGNNEAVTRTMIFVTLISANIFLTIVNRSFYYSILTTLTYKNNLLLTIICITVALTGALLYIPALNNFFEFERIDGRQLAVAATTGYVSVIWFEIVKAVKRHIRRNSSNAD
jgi:Ca2+-transporting ATPase